MNLSLHPKISDEVGSHSANQDSTSNWRGSSDAQWRVEATVVLSDAIRQGVLNLDIQASKSDLWTRSETRNKW